MNVPSFYILCRLLFNHTLKKRFPEAVLFEKLLQKNIKKDIAILNFIHFSEKDVGYLKINVKVIELQKQKNKICNRF